MVLEWKKLVENIVPRNNTIQIYGVSFRTKVINIGTSVAVGSIVVSLGSPDERQVECSDY